jgi:hypothetical protein
MASAELSGNSYLVKPPQPVGVLADFLQRLNSQAGPEGCLLLGFDFPIGLPYAYAQKAGLHSFLAALPEFGRGEWHDFYNVSLTADQISIKRPFYPDLPGGTSRQHLLDKLGFDSIDDLRRECENSPPQVRSAAPLFWTLGAQQVGKAALNGWEQVIVPGLNDPSLDILIWPFSGKMSSLIRPGRIIIAETYPTQYLHQLNLINPQRRFSKRRQSDRAEAAARLISTLNSRKIKIHQILEQSLRDGFGPRQAGDDRFDAVIGLLGMLRFFTGTDRVPEPKTREITQIEGWILGLAAE